MKKIFITILLITFCSALTACGKTPLTPSKKSTQPPASSSSKYVKTGKPYVISGVKYYPLDSVSSNYEETGIASWYGQFFHGKLTANGETYNMHDMTAAHKTLPMPTYVRVENLQNGKEIVVRVNDRGPFVKGRVIDLSYAAAKKLDMVDAGTAQVRVTVLSQKTDQLQTNNKDVNIDIGSFGIQIGAFADKNNAHNLANKYKNSAVSSVVVNGRTMYRVQVKGYNSKKAAEKALTNFEFDYPGAFIIAD